jgi:SAM-dependent methyltransferase
VSQQLRAFYNKQMFFPTWVGVLINPFYFARANLHSAMQEFSPMLHGQLLDVGCGSKPYQTLFRVDRYVGLDIDSVTSRTRKQADYFYDGKQFPLPDSSFDAVLCNQVLEHVFNPEEFLHEIVRVMKPGGRLLLTVPFVWDEHEQPYDYARYTSFGLRALLERPGLKVVRQGKLGADASVLFQLANAYFFKISRSLPRPIRALTVAPLMAAINLCGIVARWLLPSNPDLFLDHVVLAEKSL